MALSIKSYGHQTLIRLSLFIYQIKTGFALRDPPIHSNAADGVSGQFVDVRNNIGQMVITILFTA